MRVSDSDSGASSKPALKRRKKSASIRYPLNPYVKYPLVDPKNIPLPPLPIPGAESNAARSAAYDRANKPKVTPAPAGRTVRSPGTSGIPGTPGTPSRVVINPLSFLSKVSYSGPSAESMAASEYGPQYKLVDQMKGQATTSYNAAGNDSKNMYEALSRSIRGDEAGIVKQSAATTKTIGDSYNAAVKGTTNTFKGARNDVAALAKQLGVEAAVPSALQENASQEGVLTGLLNANKATQTGLSTQLGTNEVNANRDEATTASLAGTNAKSDFAMQLQTALSGLANKKLELQGGQMSAKNKYAMDIANMVSDSQTARDKINADMSKQSSDNAFRDSQAYNDNMFRTTQEANDLSLGQGRLALGQAQYGLANDKFKFEAGKPPKGTEPNAYEALANEAQKLWPGDQGKAAQAVKAVTDTLTYGASKGDGTNSRKFADVGDFLAAVVNRNPSLATDTRQLQQIAALFFNNIKGKSATGSPQDW